MKVSKIKIGFSEAPGHKPCEFNTLTQANRYLHSFAAPDGGGYYKTDFTIEFENGLQYSGTYDIGSDSYSIEEHCLGFCEMIQRYPSRYKADVLNAYRDWQPVFENLVIERCKPE